MDCSVHICSCNGGTVDPDDGGGGGGGGIELEAMPNGNAHHVANGHALLPL